MIVRILEMADRYIIVDAQSGELADGDDLGFSDLSSAVRYAESKDWEILP